MKAIYQDREFDVRPATTDESHTFRDRNDQEWTNCVVLTDQRGKTHVQQYGTVISNFTLIPESEGDKKWLAANDRKRYLDTGECYLSSEAAASIGMTPTRFEDRPDCDDPRQEVLK